MKKYKWYIVIGISILCFGGSIMYLNYRSYEKTMNEVDRVMKEHTKISNRLEETNQRLEEAKQNLADSVEKLN